jgi:hypothetical protein
MTDMFRDLKLAIIKGPYEEPFQAIMTGKY